MPRPKGFEPYTETWWVDYSAQQITVIDCGGFPRVTGFSVRRVAAFGTEAEMQSVVDWVNGQRHGPTYDVDASGRPKLGTYTNYNLRFSGVVYFYNSKSNLLLMLNDVGLRN